MKAIMSGNTTHSLLSMDMSLCTNPSIITMVEQMASLTNLTVPESCKPKSLMNCSNVRVDFVHIPNNVSQECENLERMAFTVLYPLLLTLAIFGNVLNLLVYSMPFFKGSKAVHLLRARAAVNLGYITSLLMIAIHEWCKQGPIVTYPGYETFFAQYGVYANTLTNILGNLNSWYTLLITLEIALCILQPVTYKQRVTSRTILSVIFLCVMASLVINCTLPITRTVHLTTRPAAPNAKHCIKFYAPALRHPERLMRQVEKVYYWCELLLVNCVPIFLLLLCSVVVSVRLRHLSMGSLPQMTGRRRCVLRITLATAFLHLFCSAPSALILYIAALKGSSGRGVTPAMCMCKVVGNFLNVLNSTVPFFVYVICSQQFQRMSISILKIRIVGTAADVYTSLAHERRPTVEIKTSCDSPMPLVAGINTNHVHSISDESRLPLKSDPVEDQNSGVKDNNDDAQETYL